MSASVLILSSDSSSQIILKVDEYEYSTDSEESQGDDGLWLQGTVEISSSAYSGNLKFMPRIDEFESFLSELIAARAAGAGSFSFLMLEATVDLRGHLNERGQILWKLETRHDDDGSVALQLHFAADQTMLSRLISDLTSLLDIFPRRGDEAP